MINRINHNRSAALEQSLINYFEDLYRFYAHTSSLAYMYMYLTNKNNLELNVI